MRTIIIFLFALTLHTAVAQSYSELYETGKKQIEAGEYKQACTSFKQAYDMARGKSEQFYALSGLGYAQNMAGEPGRAAESFGKAIAIDSTAIGLYMHRGNALLEADSTQAAIECYGKVLERHPDNRDALFFRAYAYTKSGMYTEGKKDYIRLLGATPDDNKARLGLAMLYQKEGSTNECLMLLDTLIEEEPENAEYYIARCNAERDFGQNELALQDAEKAVALQPLNAEYRLTLADILEKSGKNDAARRVRATAAKLSKEDEK